MPQWQEMSNGQTRAVGDSSWVFSPGYYLNTGTAFIDDVAFDRKPADW